MADKDVDWETLLLEYRKTGDITVIATVFRHHTALVYGVCLKYLKSREEAKDATMDLFEKLVVAAKTHSINHFRGWLYRTARNHCLMRLRSEKGKNAQYSDLTDVEKQRFLHPQDDRDLEGDLTALETCLQKLADDQQICIRLFFMAGKPYKQIAEETGFPLASVKSYIQNGKRNLRICMDQYAKLG